MGHPAGWAARSGADGSPRHWPSLRDLQVAPGSVRTAAGELCAEARICSVLFEHFGGLAMLWEQSFAHSTVAGLRKVWLDYFGLAEQKFAPAAA